VKICDCNNFAAKPLGALVNIEKVCCKIVTTGKRRFSKYLIYSQIKILYMFCKNGVYCKNAEKP